MRGCVYNLRTYPAIQHIYQGSTNKRRNRSLSWYHRWSTTVRPPSRADSSHGFFNFCLKVSFCLRYMLIEIIVVHTCKVTATIAINFWVLITNCGPFIVLPLYLMIAIITLMIHLDDCNLQLQLMHGVIKYPLHHSCTFRWHHTKHFGKRKKMQKNGINNHYDTLTLTNVWAWAKQLHILRK